MVEDTLFQELRDLNTRLSRVKNYYLLSNVDTKLRKVITAMPEHIQIGCIVDTCVLDNIIDFLTLYKQVQIQQLLGNTVTLLVDNLINNSKEAQSVSRHLQKLTGAKLILLDKKMRSLSTYEIFSNLERQNLHRLIETQRENRKKNGYTLDFLLKRGVKDTAWQHASADLLLTFGDKTYPSDYKISTVVIQGTDIMTDLKGSSAQCLNAATALFEAITRVPDSSFLEFCSRILVIDNKLRVRLGQIFSKMPLKTKQQIAHIITAIVFPDINTEVAISAQKYLYAPLDNHVNAYELLASTGVCSRSELRRLFSSKAVRRITPETRVLTTDYSELKDGDVVRIGKRYHIKVGAK